MDDVKTLNGSGHPRRGGDGLRLDVSDLVAASNGAAAGVVTSAIVGAVLAAPVALPIAGALIGAALGMGAHKFRQSHHGK